MNNRNVIPFLVFFLLPFVSCSSEENLLEEKIIEVDTQTNDTTITEKTDTVIAEKNDTIITEKNDTVITGKNDTVITVKYDTIISHAAHKDTIIVAYEKYMNLSPTISSSQGAACYDKYFFQGYGSNPALEVYNLDKKQYLCKINITDPKPNSKIHANSVCFGNQRYDPSDFFPLLYISSGYTTTINGYQCSYIYVFRIRKDDSDNFIIERVQTITLKGFEGWTEGIPNNDNNILWVKYHPNNFYAYASIKMPKIEDGDVTITKDDINQDFSLDKDPPNSYNQDHIFYNNRLLLVSGGSASDQNKAFIAINTITQKRELIIDLQAIGLSGEPESIFFYKGQLMIGYRSAIFIFNIRNVSGDNWL